MLYVIGDASNVLEVWVLVPQCVRKHLFVRDRPNYTILVSEHEVRIDVRLVCATTMSRQKSS